MTTQLNQIYKCEICGNIVEVLHAGAGELVCCGQPMKLQQENTIDASSEHRSVYPKVQDSGAKHIPIIERTDEGKTFVKIGSIEHPMTDEHHIEWIDLKNKDKNKICKKFLKPNEKPESKFCAKTDNVKARCYCNLHGLWMNNK